MTDAYINNIEELRTKINKLEQGKEVDVRPIIKWLENKRKHNKVEVKLVPISDLKQWEYNSKAGIIQHKKGKDHFFTVEGVSIKQAYGREVMEWDQPIFNQKEGGILVILCQEMGNGIKFLLHAKFEPGNINKMQLAPAIQATSSNLKQHHSGKKPRFSEYWGDPNTVVIYKASHNEEGGRFWKKSNINALVLVNKKINLSENDDYIWLTLGEIKKLMLYNNIVNPFVKTILSPL